MHDIFLYAALEEAKLGQGFCAPNPSVGAVAVKNGEIIARAWHRGAGKPHAERMLIAQLPPGETGLSLYLTLEPCNHFGLTPPCVDAIVQYGFERVIFAYLDPNPIVAERNTPYLLRQHGIEVEHYPIAEIDAFYQPYQLWTQTGKPWVTAKIAQSLDGKIGLSSEKRIQLSNLQCDQFTHENRLRHDIILTTARTLHLDNPQLNVRLPGAIQAKPVAILDRQLILNTAPVDRLIATHCHIFYDRRLTAPAPVENRTYHPVACDDSGLCLSDVIHQLGRIGYHSVWLEAGGQLFSAMHQAKLVNRTHIYVVPCLLGEHAVPAYHGEVSLNHPQLVTWTSMNDNVVATLEWGMMCSQG